MDQLLMKDRSPPQGFSMSYFKELTERVCVPVWEQGGRQGEDGGGVKEKTASCLFQLEASRWEVIFYSSCGGSSHLSAQMLNEYGNRPCCRLINTALARGARPARLHRAATAHRVPARHWSRTQHCRSVLWARSRQLAPRRSGAAALCSA